MPVYETQFLGEAVPIKPVKTTRKKSKKVVASTEEKSLPSPPASIDLPMDESIDVPVSEKIASPTKKTRKRKSPVKKVEIEKEEKEEEPTTTKTIEPPVLKKQKKSKPQPSQQILDEAKTEVEEMIKKVVKKKVKAPVSKKIIDGEEAQVPPAWFKEHLINEEHRRNQEREKKERASIKEVKRVGEEKATVKWNDGETRDKVNNQITNHMNKLYSQIHGRRL